MNRQGRDWTDERTGQMKDKDKSKTEDNTKYRLKASPLTLLILRAILLALSFILSAIDHSLPTPLAGVPGMSLGLANITVLFALVFLSWKDALVITVVKSLFVFFLRGPVALLLSISGGLLALLCEILIWKISRHKSSLLLLSATGGLMPNMGQVTAYALYARVRVWILLPPLAITGIIAGSLTALVLKALCPFMERWFQTRRRHDV